MDHQTDIISQDPVARRLDIDIGCRIVAALQVLGGAFLISGFFYYYNPAIPVYTIVLLLVFPVWGIVAGTLLWMGRVQGLKQSMILQALQIITVEGPAFAWRLYLGLKVDVGWLNPGKVLDFEFGGDFFVGLGEKALFFGFAINLVAVAAFKYLLSFKRKQQRKWALQKETVVADTETGA